MPNPEANTSGMMRKHRVKSIKITKTGKLHSKELGYLGTFSYHPIGHKIWFLSQHILFLYAEFSLLFKLLNNV